MTITPIDFAANPGMLCLGLPILLLFAFLGYTAIAFGRRTRNDRTSDSRITRAIEGSGVNGMTQMDFRTYVMRLLAQQGYTTDLPRIVAGADDIGTDLIATAIKDGKRYSVYALRYAKALSPRAVTEANYNMGKYECDAAMVVTNGTLRGDALKLAQETNCVVIDRAELANWIMAHQPQTEAH